MGHIFIMFIIFIIFNTLWLFHIAMENSPCIDGSPIKNDDFPWQTVSHNQMVIETVK